ncbi:MAG: group 1 truncated hemoglobin [Deltaproteobacteria bacterium]|nr:group 1 truncated hemoglobin [Deltaproteobacteria bacterium]
MRIRMMMIAALAALTLVACGGKTKGGGGGGGGKSLYDRLGGKDAITAVVDAFIKNVAADEAIKDFFQNADIAGLKQKLADQICEATGGPCKYTGKDMKTAHTGMGVKDEHFNALVGDLKKALDALNVPEKEQGELLGALAGLKGDIVTP